MSGVDYKEFWGGVDYRAAMGGVDWKATLAARSGNDGVDYRSALGGVDWRGTLTGTFRRVKPAIAFVGAAPTLGKPTLVVNP